MNNEAIYGGIVVAAVVVGFWAYDQVKLRRKLRRK